MWKRMRNLLGEQGMRAVSRTVTAVMNSPTGQETVARAVGAAQRGKKRLDDAQRQVLRALGYAGRPEYRELLKNAARLKRKARELSENLASLD